MPAKKKKKKVGVHHKKKKMGATSEIMDFGLRVLGTVAGAATGAFIIQAGNTALASQNLPAWAVPAAVAATGAAIPLIVKKNPLAFDFGLGMTAVGGIMMINELGLSIPGISGLAMSSNAGPANNVLRAAVGCNQNQQKIGQGTGQFLSQTVGARPGRSKARMGALLSS
jgi:hypothetical protein